MDTKIEKINAGYISVISMDEKIKIQEYITKNKIKLRSSYLKDWSGKGYIFLPGEGNELPYGDIGNVIVIDISSYIWMKCLGNVHNRTQINGMSYMDKRHKKSEYGPIWSFLGNCPLLSYKDFIGTFIIYGDIGEYPIILVDYEYKWRQIKGTEKKKKEEDYKKRNNEYNVTVKKAKEEDLQRIFERKKKQIKEKSDEDIRMRLSKEIIKKPDVVKESDVIRELSVVKEHDVEQMIENVGQESGAYHNTEYGQIVDDTKKDRAVLKTESEQIESNNEKIQRLEKENKELKEEMCKDKEKIGKDTQIQKLKALFESIIENKFSQIVENFKDEMTKKDQQTERRMQELVDELKEVKIEKTEPEKILTKEKSRTTNIEYHKRDTVDNTITGATLRTNIFEIISGLSKENKKCNNMILVNNFYKKGYQNYEIYSALNLMEKENIIYKIIYVDWFIKEKYRDNDIDTANKLWIDIFNIIKNFSKKYNWNYGIKRSDLYDELLKKDHLEADIGIALESMKNQDIIYNKTYIYWFTNEYKGHIKEEITEEDAVEEDIIEFPKSKESKIEIIEPNINTSLNGEMVKKDQQIEIGEMVKKDQQIEKLDKKIENLEISKVEAEKAKVEAEKAKVEAEKAKVEAEKAKVEAEKAKVEAKTSEMRADSARMWAIKAEQTLDKEVGHVATEIGCRIIIPIITTKDRANEIQGMINRIGIVTEIVDVVVKRRKK